MDKHSQMRLWKYFWRRTGMYVGEPSVHLISTYWFGFESGQEPTEESAKLYSDFISYAQKKTRLSFAAVGIRAVQYKYDAEFGRGKISTRKAVAYLTQLAHTYGAKRFGAKAYTECDPKL